MSKPLQKHSVSIRGHRTSLSLEEEFWNEIQKIARVSGISVAGLITEIDEHRNPEQNLSSALRIHVLKALQNKLPSEDN